MLFFLVLLPGLRVLNSTVQLWEELPEFRCNEGSHVLVEKQMYFVFFSDNGGDSVDYHSASWKLCCAPRRSAEASLFRACFIGAFCRLQLC